MNGDGRRNHSHVPSEFPDQTSSVEELRLMHLITAAHSDVDVEWHPTSVDAAEPSGGPVMISSGISGCLAEENDAGGRRRPNASWQAPSSSSGAANGRGRSLRIRRANDADQPAGRLEIHLPFGQNEAETSVPPVVDLTLSIGRPREWPGSNRSQVYNLRHLPC